MDPVSQPTNVQNNQNLDVNTVQPPPKADDIELSPQFKEEAQSPEKLLNPLTGRQRCAKRCCVLMLFMFINLFVCFFVLIYDILKKIDSMRSEDPGYQDVFKAYFENLHKSSFADGLTWTIMGFFDLFFLTILLLCVCITSYLFRKTDIGMHFGYVNQQELKKLIKALNEKENMHFKNLKDSIQLKTSDQVNADDVIIEPVQQKADDVQVQLSTNGNDEQCALEGGQEQIGNENFNSERMPAPPQIPFLLLAPPTEAQTEVNLELPVNQMQTEVAQSSPRPEVTQALSPSPNAEMIQAPQQRPVEMQESPPLPKSLMMESSPPVPPHVIQSTDKTETKHKEDLHKMIEDNMFDYS